MADARNAGLSEIERMAMVDFIAANPTAGEIIPGSGGARKIRFAGRGKGKSGGYRTITYFGGNDIPVFLLAMFGKGDRANLSKAERNELRKILADIGPAYRQGRRETIRRIR